jgi:hypothetical protein
MSDQPWKELPPASWKESESLVKSWQQTLATRDQPPRDGLLLGTNLSTSKPGYITPQQISTHMHVLGASGVGKSFFLESLIKELILHGQGVCVIDPHGDLYERLLEFCAWLHTKHNKRFKIAERLIPFNIAESKQVMGFNPVARNARIMTYQVVALMEAIRKAWGQSSFQETPRLARWLFNTAYAIIEGKLTLLQSQYLVTTEANPYRPAIIERITNPRIKAEWEWLSSAKPERREERVESCLNRLKLFVEHERLRLIFGQSERTLDFSSVLSGQKILLVNLASQNTIDEENQRMLGTLLINELLTAAFARPRGKRPPFYVVIDEFAKFVIKDICAILDGGRKFGLHLILAHQHLRQLREQDPEVYFSTMTNARLKSVFGGLNVEDVETMAKELFLKELNPDEVKDEIWQTKLMPKETTRTVRSDSWSEGTGESVGEITHASLASGEMFIPGSGFWAMPELKGTSNMSGSGGSSGSGRSSSSSQGSTTTEVPF